MKMTPERYFFMYAFPCSQVLLQMGKLNQEEYNDLEKGFLENNTPSRKVLEKVFIAAFGRIKKLAEKMGKDYWDIEVMKRYWESEHNIIIDEGDGLYEVLPESFKDLCKVHKAKVIEIKNIKNNKKMLIVEYGNAQKRPVFDVLIPNAKVGDVVTIHYGYGVEKIN